MNGETGLVYNFTGNGKGKTSAALGIVLRALGWHWKIAMIQFLKGSRLTGELNFFREYFPALQVEPCGLGFTNRPGDHAGYAAAGWRRATELLADFDGELLVLDELNNALAHGFLNVDEVVNVLRNRRPELNVVITGRHALPEIIAVSDLVSEISEIKHPYREGIGARKGLDY